MICIQSIIRLSKERLFRWIRRIAGSRLEIHTEVVTCRAYRRITLTHGIRVELIKRTFLLRIFLVARVLAEVLLSLF